MEAGYNVWCTADPKGDDAWILAEVLKKSEDELELQQVDKKENVFKRPIEVKDEESGERKFKGVELANTPLSDEDRAEGRDNDLITLPHLHEPAILHSVSERFFHGKIYTWTGPVLIAVNPFQRLPLYTDVSEYTVPRLWLFLAIKSYILPFEFVLFPFVGNS
jgi:myosin heavy subunit